MLLSLPSREPASTGGVGAVIIITITVLPVIFLQCFSSYRALYWTCLLNLVT